MYTDYFKLSGKPFQLSPNPRFYFGSRGHEKAMAYLQYGLHQSEGFIVITGDIGTGKTTLIGYLLGQLDNAKYVTAKLVTTQLEADDMLRMVASAFGMDPRGLDKATLLGAFERFLLDNQRQGRRALVLVDEVQNLPMRSLEELRMLSNFQAGDVAPVQFCLVGQPQFRQMMASDDLMQLRQRVIASYHLGPLSSDETRNYIEHRLHLVNWQSDPTITGAAYTRIHDRTAGIPRQINVLCDRLFLCAMLEELHEISGEVVETVVGEMSSEGARAIVDVDRSQRPALEASTVRVNRQDDADIGPRLANVEKLVQVHERTIRRAIELVASYFDRGSATLSGGMSDGKKSNGERGP
jgi:general secretion pathway protein A